MIQSVCYAFIYLFEVLACFMFFENFYVRKQSTTICIIAYFLAFVIQFAVCFVTVPLVNLISFMICNFLIAMICYESNFKICIFTTLMLSFFMFITEMIVLYTSTYIFKIDFAAYENNLLTLVTQSSLSKLLFFIVVFLVSKFLKNKANQKTNNKVNVLLALFPLTSIVNLHVLYFWGVKTSYTSPFNAILSVCSILLLFANLFVFYIYEMVQKANLEITQLQLEKQRGEISSEYYELLSKEYDNSRIIIHDIKNHLNYISNKNSEGDTKGVAEYIDAIYKDFGLDSKIKYSGNKLIDVILNRYAEKCRRTGLDLEIESCGSNLEFMSEVDTVALLDNLFENAIEASMISTDKKITFSMYRKASSLTVTDYVVVSLTNSCDTEPKSRNGELLSSKANVLSHGIGTKSIKRIVNKYNGNFDWQYDKEEKEFKASAVLQIN